MITTEEEYQTAKGFVTHMEQEIVRQQSLMNAIYGLSAKATLYNQIHAIKEGLVRVKPQIEDYEYQREGICGIITTTAFPGGVGLYRHAYHHTCRRIIEKLMQAHIEPIATVTRDEARDSFESCDYCSGQLAAPAIPLEIDKDNEEGPN